MKKIRFLALLLSAPMLFGACSSDSKTGPKDGDGNGGGKVGEFYVRADISGSYKGKFNATGSTTYNPKAKTAAMGFWDEDEETGEPILVIAGAEADGKAVVGDNDFIGRSLSLILLNPKVGTYGSDRFCWDDEIDDVDSCVLVFFSSTTASADHSSMLTSGTVKITTLTNNRIAGTFEGSGDTYDKSGKPTASIEMKGGQFDVPIIDVSAYMDLQPNPSWRSRLDALNP
jgi:hypothetical protein